jgi:hypothetical protein
MKKSKAYILVFSFTILLVLFIFVGDVNLDENLYKIPMLPDIELSDGINSIKCKAKLTNWHYKGIDQKFHLLVGSDNNNDAGDIDSIGVKVESCGNSLDSDPINGQVVFQYMGSLSLLFDQCFIENYQLQPHSHSQSNSQSQCQSRSRPQSQSQLQPQYQYQYYYPDKINLQIFCKGDLVYQDAGFVLDGDFFPADNIGDEGKEKLAISVFQPKERSELLYRVIASWYKTESADRGFYGEGIYEFNFVNNVPAEFEVSPCRTYPGELVKIEARYIDKGDEITIKSDLWGPSHSPDLINVEIPFYNCKGDERVAILPLDYNLNPGEYRVELAIKGIRDGEQEETEESNKVYQIVQGFNINVLPKEFPIQYLTVSEEVEESTRTDEAYEEYNKYIGAVRNVRTPLKMWEGTFLQPVDGRISTEFGMRRFVNNAPTSYRHLLRLYSCLHIEPVPPNLQEHQLIC